MPTDCFINSAGCVECPFIPHVPATPPHVVQTGLPGWNAGGNSIVALDDDLHVVWNVPAGAVGIVLGFRQSRTNNVEPTLISHGVQCTNIAGIDLISVVEFGSTVYGPTTRADPAAAIEIRRSGGHVTYLLDDEVIYESTRQSLGVVLVNGCEYVSGDTIV
jgi:hypothetical protein